MKVAIIQMRAGQDKRENIARAEKLVCAAICCQAKFILLPEAFSSRAAVFSASLRKRAKENIPGESIVPFIRLAQKHRVHILAGSICEAIPRTTKVHNTSLLINPRGERVAVYRKQNLFNANLPARKIRESKIFIAGKKLAYAPVGPFRVGLSICFDIRFPALYQKYAQNGVNVFCVPSCFTKTTGQAHWETLLRARAIENLCYVLAPNQYGKDRRGATAYGNSMIVDPWGKILAQAPANKETTIYADMDLQTIKQARARLPKITKNI